MSQTATAQTATATQEQGTHFYILTLQKPMNGGFMVATSSGVCSPTGMSRYDLYTWLVGEMVRQTPQLAGASTLHFDLRSNQI
ncbi:hypothetical protein [Kitasatospora griseola]|uniref:hypothetical protein n=1 Tax=Kitasatospora griseola TaxID=2064 RepID=UPI00381D71E1